MVCETVHKTEEIAVMIPWAEADLRLSRFREKTYGCNPGVGGSIDLLPGFARRLNENEVPLPHPGFRFVVVICALTVI